MPGRRQAQPRPATLKAVAERAGVSTSTASLVFSGKGPVAPATAERVRAAAGELGYAGPNPLAASLRTGRSGLVAVILQTPVLDALRDPYAVTVLDGLAGSLDDLGAGILLVTQAGADGSQALRQLRAASVDAACFFTCSSGPAPVVADLAARGIPLVGMGAPRDPRVVQADVDNRAAMRDIASHLRELGHTRVAQVTLPVEDAPTGPVPAERIDVPDDPHVRDRITGVCEVFGPRVPTICPPRADVEAGAVALRSLLADDERPTAVIAHSDMLALGIVRAAEDGGLDVPQDLSVTGFDGIETPWWPRTLTTISQPGAAKGEAAGRLLQQALAGETITDLTLPHALRVGDTSGPPPG